MNAKALIPSLERSHSRRALSSKVREMTDFFASMEREEQREGALLSCRSSDSH